MKWWQEHELNQKFNPLWLVEKYATMTQQQHYTEDEGCSLLVIQQMMLSTSFFRRLLTCTFRCFFPVNLQLLWILIHIKSDHEGLQLNPSWIGGWEDSSGEWSLREVWNITTPRSFMFSITLRFFSGLLFFHQARHNKRSVTNRISEKMATISSACWSIRVRVRVRLSILTLCCNVIHAMISLHWQVYSLLSFQWETRGKAPMVGWVPSVQLLRV